MAIDKKIEWGIESIRVTTFVNGDFIPDALEKWQGIICQESPSEIHKTLTSFSGVSRCHNGFLKITWNSNRLDVKISPETIESDQIIGNISQINEIFELYINRLVEIEDFPVVDRLAIGVVLTYHIENELEGLNLLETHIKSLQINPSMKDLLFRVNHINTSRSNEGLIINRLATWSVGQSQLIKLELSPSGEPLQKVVSEGFPILRLELDINTDKNKFLGNEITQTTNLLTEMETSAVDIANYGEIKMID